MTTRHSDTSLCRNPQTVSYLLCTVSFEITIPKQFSIFPFEQLPGKCKHTQLCRILADLVHANMNVSPGYEATVDISRENMVFNVTVLSQIGLPCCLSELSFCKRVFYFQPASLAVNICMRERGDAANETTTGI